MTQTLRDSNISLTYSVEGEEHFDDTVRKCVAICNS